MPIDSVLSFRRALNEDDQETARFFQRRRLSRALYALRQIRRETDEARRARLIAFAEKCERDLCGGLQ